MQITSIYLTDNDLETYGLDLTKEVITDQEHLIVNLVTHLKLFVSYATIIRDNTSLSGPELSDLEREIVREAEAILMGEV